jgi:O-antigen ligase
MLAVGIAASVCSAAFGGVAALEGGHRVHDGLIVLAALLVIAGLAALLAARPARGEEPDAPPPWARHIGPATAGIVALVAIGLIVGGLGEKASPEDLARGAGARRLTTVHSNRYEYWRVALVGFGDQPLHGVGAGGFRVLWLKERTVDESVRDTHSIEFEMASELGLVGLLTLALLIGGTAAAAREALRRDRAAAAGLAAALLAWLLHASIDWDWQLPAVSLPAIALAGALIALAER